MCTKSGIGCMVLLFLICSICFCDGLRRNNKFKRIVDSISELTNNKVIYNNASQVEKEDEAKGFLTHGGLFSLGKVLNFFPVGGERECQPSTFTIARAGICLNPYDCRQRDGKASGDCAHGLGVCCVFEVTCGATIQNNLTYFMSPSFPELWTGEKDCTVRIDKSHAGIMQLRIDFVHFTIGQPNRTTGQCDEDVMILGEGATNFTLCGQNHGQHIYYTLPSGSETKEAGELPRSKSIPLVIRMRGSDTPRLWLLRLAQMPLAHSSPHSCLQYHAENNGTIKTFNYASNGRHLASQEYRACVRRNVGFCSIRYMPCDNRSFRIGPRDDNAMDPGPGSAGGAGSGFYGPDGSFVPNVPTIIQTTASPPTTTLMDQALNGTDQMDEMMPVNEEQNEEEEGSGEDPQIVEASTHQPGIMSRIWSYIWPWRQRSLWSWSPYHQYYSDNKLGSYGYGNYVSKGYGRLRCTDRITIPCENEYFVSSQLFGAGVCDPHHCGSTFCRGADCRVETSITPFAVSVHFGPPTRKRSPEDNIGMCLRYTQVPCDS